MHALPDGTYDVFVVDVDEHDDGSVRLELAITFGEHKGELIAVRVSRVDDHAMLLLGLPGTLRVDGGVPRVELER